MRLTGNFSTRPQRILAVAGITGLSIFSAGVVATDANATGQTITATVNSSSCPSTLPTLVNGSFEDFSNPALGTVAHGYSSPYSFGYWHGYGTEGPDQILFLNPSLSANASYSSDTSNPNYLTGWKSTSTWIEIQRQVGNYTTYHWDSDVNTSPQPVRTVTVPRTGVASLANISGTGYIDAFAPQPAAGDYWVELNATEASALYQDVVVPTNARIFWSIKHRGRSDYQEKANVLIGEKAVGSAGVMSDGALTVQTGYQKFTPSNVDRFTGTPTYGNTGTTVNEMSDSLSDGWGYYVGTYAPGSAGGTRNLRMQFQSTSGAFGDNVGWHAAVGNLLDDVQLTPFIACPATQSLHVGQTATLDITGDDGSGNSTNVSYGLNQSLNAVGNTTANQSEFATNGNTVSFTPTAAGTFTADYEVAMTYAGQTYLAASTITYTVSASPIVTFDPNHDSVATSAQTVTMGNALSTITFPTPTRQGYTFDGWYTSPTGGTEATASYASSTSPTSDLTLYAHWTAIPVATVTSGNNSVPLASTGINMAGPLLLATILIGIGSISLFIKRRFRSR